MRILKKILVAVIALLGVLLAGTAAFIRMNTDSVKETQKIEPNTVYVIAPGSLLTTTGDELGLTTLEPERGKCASGILLASVITNEAQCDLGN